MTTTMLKNTTTDRDNLMARWKEISEEITNIITNQQNSDIKTKLEDLRDQISKCIEAHPCLSIIIPLYNRLHDLEVFLNGYFNNTATPCPHLDLYAKLLEFYNELLKATASDHVLNIEKKLEELKFLEQYTTPSVTPNPAVYECIKKPCALALIILSFAILIVPLFVYVCMLIATKCDPSLKVWSPLYYHYIPLAIFVLLAIYLISKYFNTQLRLNLDKQHKKDMEDALLQIKKNCLLTGIDDNEFVKLHMKNMIDAFAFHPIDALHDRKRKKK